MDEITVVLETVDGYDLDNGLHLIEDLTMGSDTWMAGHAVDLMESL